jgi:hypothetical protein
MAATSAQPDFTNAPEVAEAGQIAERIAGRAAALVIATPAEYESAGQFLKEVKAEQKRVEALQDSITRPLMTTLNAVRALFKPRLERIAQAESVTKRSLIAYQDEQDRIRRREQAEAEERARKERERLERQSAKAQESGRVERADELAQRAATVVVPVIQREPPKVMGLSTREVWKFEITDPSKINGAFTIPDEKKIGAQVRALKGDAAAIIGPGVRVWCEKQLASGAA